MAYMSQEKKKSDKAKINSSLNVLIMRIVAVPI